MIKLKTIVLVHLSETSHMLRLNKLLQSDLKYSVPPEINDAIGSSITRC